MAGVLNTQALDIAKRAAQAAVAGLRERDDPNVQGSAPQGKKQQGILAFFSKPKAAKSSPPAVKASQQSAPALKTESAKKQPAGAPSKPLATFFKRSDNSAADPGSPTPSAAKQRLAERQRLLQIEGERNAAVRSPT